MSLMTFTVGVFVGSLITTLLGKLDERDLRRDLKTARDGYRYMTEMRDKAHKQLSTIIQATQGLKVRVTLPGGSRAYKDAWPIINKKVGELEAQNVHKQG